MSTLNPTIIEDGELTYLPLTAIGPKEGFNPRTYFDDAEHRSLVESIKAEGLLQPIMVRPRPEHNRGDWQDGQYWIVMGERRWRAARDARLEEIPCVVRHLDEQQAYLMAIKENMERSQMSPAEEAKAARCVLSACQGDKDEAQRQLGWSLNKLNARLLLLNADDSVLKALSERRIRLGHAELLSTLPASTQSGTVSAVIEQNITVQALRERLAGFARSLDSACFDTTECQTCPHSSTMQAELFAENIGTGQCSNHTCFTEKTRAALTVKKETLAQEYPVVWLDFEKDPSSFTLVCERGDSGVGREQFAACQGCGDFGALVRSAPGQEGQVIEDTCFNLSCNAEKVKAYKASRTKPKAVASTGQEGQKPAADKPEKAASSGAKPKAAAATTPKKVVEAVNAFYRNLAADQATGDARMMQMFICMSALHIASMPLQIGKNHNLKTTGTSDRAALIGELHARTPEEMSKIIAECVDHLLRTFAPGQFNGETDLIRTAERTVALLGTDLSAHFKIDEAFLRAHTKSGIEALLKEAGYDQWHERTHGEKSFAKLMGGKVDAIVETVLKGDYDWTGFVPACVTARLGQHKTQANASVAVATAAIRKVA